MKNCTRFYFAFGKFSKYKHYILRCNKKVRAVKKYSIKTIPNILVIHLKRFDFSHAGKMSHYVSYPEKINLNLLNSGNELVSGKL